MSDYELGQRVTFTHPMRRACPFDYSGPYRKEWVPNTVAAPTEGVVVGVRTLSNGAVTYSDVVTYRPSRDGYFTAYLIAYDMRRKPVFVRPEHIEPADTP